MTEACINFSPFLSVYPGNHSMLVHRDVPLPFYGCVKPHFICVRLFNQSPRFEHLVCFQYFVITNSATINNLNLVRVCIFISLELYLQGKFLKWIGGSEGKRICSSVRYSNSHPRQSYHFVSQCSLICIYGWDWTVFQMWKSHLYIYIFGSCLFMCSLIFYGFLWSFYLAF